MRAGRSALMGQSVRWRGSAMPVKAVHGLPTDQG
jgi:hypothetical protein